MNKRPHIILFNPDQFRSDALGHLGKPGLKTPVLDQACHQDCGDFVSFRKAFCQNPVCTPSRCSFMSGWYPHVRGHRTMTHMLHAERDEPILLKQLKDAGYFVWWGGKNDLIPAQDGFGHVCDIKHEPSLGTLPFYGRDRSWRGEENNPDYYSFHVGKIDKGSADHYHDFDWDCLTAACDFIDKYHGEAPLCLYLPLTYPHPPYGVEDPWYSKIDRDRLFDRIKSTGTGKPCILEGIRTGQGLENWSEDHWTELRAIYHGMCSRIDHQFGLILKALREKDMYDDSAIFFFSDHGDFTGDYGLVEKTQNTFEDCLTRVPFLTKPPKNRPSQPRVSEALIELVDLTATVYDYAGITPDYDHFGQSLAPVVAGERDTHRDAVFCEGGRRPGETQAMESGPNANPSSLYWPRLRLQGTDQAPHHTKAVMCRTQNAKYVFRQGESDELYDLRTDPLELENRIKDPAMAETLLELKDRLLRWSIETADVVPHQKDERNLK